MTRPALRAALLACVLFVPAGAMAQQAQYPWSQSEYVTLPLLSNQVGGYASMVIPGCVTGTAADVGPNVAVYCGTHGTVAASGSTGGTSTTTATIAVIPVTTTQTSGTTSSSSGTWTQLLAAPTGGNVRKGCTVENTSAGTEYVYFGAGAPSGLAIGLAIAAGTPLDCAHGGLVVAQDAVWIASASASAAYVLLAQ